DGIRDFHVTGVQTCALPIFDATTGQNALNQVEIFSQKAGVTGLVMTKLDGTARGGILVAIARKFGLPIHYIGVGEAIGDLEAFRSEERRVGKACTPLLSACE